MAEQAPTKTSSQVRMGLYEEAERELLLKLKQKEKELKTLLAELHTTRNLLEEAAHDLELDELKETTQKKEVLKKEIQNLEEVAKSVTQELVNRNQQPYQTITQQELNLATGYDARKDLYNLLYKTRWDVDDAKRFFTITQAHHMANDYDFNPLVRENLDQTYKVIRQVVEHQQEQIKATYQPTLPSPSTMNLETTLADVKFSAKTTSNTLDKLYKPATKIKYVPATPKVLRILKKK